MKLGTIFSVADVLKDPGIHKRLNKWNIRRLGPKARSELASTAIDLIVRIPHELRHG